MKPVPLLFILPFVVIGLIFVAIGAVTGWSTWNSLASAQRVEGKVIELVRTESRGRTGKGGTVSSKPGFAPLVQYQVDGTTYRIQGHVSSSTPSYAVGEGVVILYSPDNPAEGRIDSFTEKWLVPIIFGGSGLLFTLIGFGMLWRRRRGAQLQPA